MMKLFASLGAALLLGLSAAPTRGGDVCQGTLSAPETLGAPAHAGAAPEESAVTKSTSSSRIPVPMQDMSDEEKERRRQVCDKLYDACCEWCDRSKKKDPKAWSKCRGDCFETYQNCLKEIPSRPK